MLCITLLELLLLYAQKPGGYPQYPTKPIAADREFNH